MPAGVFLSELLVWRWAFGMAGVVAVAVLVLLLVVMPSLPARGGRGLRDVPALIRNKNVLLGFAAILALFGGQTRLSTHGPSPALASLAPCAPRQFVDPVQLFEPVVLGMFS